MLIGQFTSDLLSTPQKRPLHFEKYTLSRAPLVTMPVKPAPESSLEGIVLQSKFVLFMYSFPIISRPFSTASCLSEKAFFCF